MHWSKTRHVDYITCARRFFYANIAAPRNPSIAALAKQQTPPLLRHEIVRALVLRLAQTDSPTKSELDEIFATARVKLASTVSDKLEVNAQMSIIEGCVTNFINDSHRIIRASSIVYISQGDPAEFVYDGISMMALPELVIEKDGQFQIFVIKTTSFNNWINIEESNIRASGLVCWARSVLGVLDRPIIIKEVYLRDASVSRNIRLLDEDIKSFLDDVRAVTAAYSISAKILDFPATPDSQKCRFCHFREICPEWIEQSELDFDISALSARAISRRPQEIQPTSERKPIFLAHASEDKDKYVIPIARLLETKGIPFWIDEGEILWGDSLSRAINQGLRDADYLICFITDAFLGRGWPETETSAILHSELSGGEQRILPLLIAPPEAFYNQYPLLRDKRYLRWDDGFDNLIKQLQDLLRRRKKRKLPSSN